MAHILSDDLEDKFASTDIKFSDGDNALQAFFKTTPANPFTISDANWRSGTSIPPDVVPTKAQLTKGDEIYDCRIVRGGAMLVSARFKDCVEELEPGRHQFFPITVEDKRGTFKPGPFFIFNVVGYIDSIIEEQSNLKASGRGQIKAWGYTRRVGPWKCALNTSVIGARACWTELRYEGRWFVSDRLAEIMRARGLMGFAFDEHCQEVSI